ncbi:MAG: hypothetical protein MPN21_04665 [Thermoanaerobaculia bacterium]|nr:hypothetical protein [Thermoanaerobaculia bacterium]
MTRYQGKPFLRLLELYVLWAIDALDASHENEIRSLSTELQKVYGRPGAWHEIIEAQMDFPQGMADELLKMWSENKRIAEDKAIHLIAQEWVEQVVDDNFI